mmetsp:Transcript_13887/g.29792  ORF Transcript_13887/g.29792 Transcript_13887/m.29792 type:complete len:413 (+) Transcript_13887:96-1334(+)
MKRSFLHSASAKSIVERFDGCVKNSIGGAFGVDDDPATILDGGLRCLLVEEEEGDPLISNELPSAGIKSGRTYFDSYSNLALSLAMDAARAAVSSSSIPCRGCGSLENQRGCKNRMTALKSSGGNGESKSSCQCCKVSFLIPSLDFPRGTNNSSKSRRKRKRRRAPAILQFPMNCLHQGEDEPGEVFGNSSGNTNQRKWDIQLLNNVHIQYVQSIEEVIRYLMYAPSLPKQLQPLDGIFLLGIGKLCSHGRYEDSKERDIPKMEISHVLSTLADTGNILEDKRRELLLSTASKSTNFDQNDVSNHERITLVATIDQSTLSSMTPKMQKYLHQWVDFVASLEKTEGCKPFDGHYRYGGVDVVSTWELVFKHGHVRNSENDSDSISRQARFRFNVVQKIDDSDNAPCFEVVWTV